MAEARPSGILWRLRDMLAANAGAILINISALVIIFGFGVMGWELLEPNPIRSVQTLRVEPEDRIIDRSKEEHLVITRRVCATREASVRLARSWVDEGGGVVNALDDWVWVEQGCHDRSPIHVYPPSSLAEGLHRYRTTLQWCNSLKCRDFHIEDVEVTVIGRRPAYSRPPVVNRF